MAQSPLVSETPSSSRDLELPGSQSKILGEPDQTPSHSSRLGLLMNVSVDNDRSKSTLSTLYGFHMGAGNSEGIFGTFKVNGS